VRCEVVAVGTELLLGQVVDTNSALVGDRLALAGIDCHYQTRVGDNEARLAAVLRLALDRNDAVVVCGGLGPTPDDVTREALAAALGVPLERDPAMAERVRGIFAERGRPMPASNLRQADRPAGCAFIHQVSGTAPGLVCPAGDGKVIYALPGVPHELEEMLERAVVPDLRRRAGGTTVIRSRVLRTWGVAESALAELIGDRVAAQTNPTIAFLARGVEGIQVRLTAKAEGEEAARRLLEAEEVALRDVLGDLVFGVDDRSMEVVVGDLAAGRGLTIGVAESLTGGLVGARLTEVPGASGWFRGSIVAYDRRVKHRVLGVPEGPVVSAAAAGAMAEGAARVLGADLGLGVTGVAGPAPQDGRPPGTVFLAVALGGATEVREARLPGDRHRVRQYAAISLLDLARRRLLAGR
jgi:nicotinamide-nucleotide amidase